MLPSRQRTPAATLTEAPACRQCQQRPPGLQLTPNPRQSFRLPGRHLGNTARYTRSFSPDAAVLTTRRPEAFPGGWRPLRPPGVRPWPAGLPGRSRRGHTPSSLRLISTCGAPPGLEGREDGRSQARKAARRSLTGPREAPAQPCCAHRAARLPIARPPQARGPGLTRAWRKASAAQFLLPLKSRRRQERPFHGRPGRGSRSTPPLTHRTGPESPQDHALGQDS